MVASKLEVICDNGSVKTYVMPGKRVVSMAASEPETGLKAASVDTPVSATVTIAPPRIHPVGTYRETAAKMHTYRDGWCESCVVEKICAKEEFYTMCSCAGLCSCASGCIIKVGERGCVVYGIVVADRSAITVFN